MNTRIMVGLALACAFGAAQARAQAVSTDAAPAASSGEENAAMSGYAGPAAAPAAGRVVDAGTPDPDGGNHSDAGRIGHVQRAAHLSAPDVHPPHIVTHHLGRHGRK